MRHPGDDPKTFTSHVACLLREHGWYSSGNGWRETSDYDRGTRPALSAGQVCDELIRRDWAAVAKEDA